MLDFQKRLLFSLLTAALLGLICVLVANLRFGPAASFAFLFSLWFNRLLMGLVIGAPWPQTSLSWTLLRGAGLGIFVSFAFFSFTAFTDWISFLPGLFQGMIIAGVGYYLLDRGQAKERA